MGSRDENIRQKESSKQRKAAESDVVKRPDVRKDTEQAISHNPLNGKPKTK